jgi:glycosyltransferase involved in cell wall biosynthesis
MLIDVVIPTCNRKDFVVSTLQSLKANTVQNFHIWIVDQSDDSETANAVQPIAAQDLRIDYIHLSTKGVNIARNVGIIAGKAPIIALTDDDCKVAENWLETILAGFESYPHCNSIFGRIQPIAVTKTAVPPSEFQEIQYMQKILPMAIKDTPVYQVFGEDRFNLGFGHGANMAFRRSAFYEVGLFDEFLGAGAPLRSWPEKDIGYRILASGGKILYSPDVLVFHSHWRSWSSVKMTYRNYGFGTGAAIGKYIRAGDWGSFKLLKEWIIQMGFRQILSGIFKHKSWKKIYVGLLQLIYPWVGMWHSKQYIIDKQYTMYVGKKGQTQSPIPIMPTSTTKL